MLTWSHYFFFLKRRQKICLNLLIKKKKIAQLINGKPDENRYNNHHTHGLLPKQDTPWPPWPPSSPNTPQPPTPYTWTTQQHPCEEHFNKKERPTPKEQGNKNRDHLSSSQECPYVDTLVVPKWLLLSSAGLKAITHLLNFSLDWHPRHVPQFVFHRHPCLQGEMINHLWAGLEKFQAVPN
jgi:hypothetical protein